MRFPRAVHAAPRCDPRIVGAVLVSPRRRHLPGGSIRIGSTSDGIHKAMLLSPTRHSTASDLLRVAAAWLMVVLVFQGMAAARALGSGPLHHHGDAGPS